MTLTPRQIVAYLEFNDTLDRVERLRALQIAVTAQGDQKAIDKMVRELTG